MFFGDSCGGKKHSRKKWSREQETKADKTRHDDGPAVRQQDDSSLFEEKSIFHLHRHCLARNGVPRSKRYRTQPAVDDSRIRSQNGHFPPDTHSPSPTHSHAIIGLVSVRLPSPCHCARFGALISVINSNSPMCVRFGSFVLPDRILASFCAVDLPSRRTQ